MVAKILFVDDEDSLRFAYKNHLKNAGYEVEVSGDYHTVLSLLSSFEPDVVVADIILGGLTGIDLLREIRGKGVTCPVIMITGEPNVTTAMEAVKLGAYDYLAKPFRKEKLLRVIEHALREKRALEEKERYQQNLEAVFSSIRDGIVTVDEEFRIIETNRSFGKMCGLEQEDLKGSSIRDLPPPFDEVCLQGAQHTLQTREPLVDAQIEPAGDGGPPKIFLLNSSSLKRKKKHTGVVLVIRDITRVEGLEKELRQRYSFHSIIGKSEQMQRIYSLLEILADTDATVMINGESGTGKELVARALHHQSDRRNGPLITVDCSTLTESILESELFGHIKGSFTGAVKDKTGRLQRADGGTLFLDEIGNISSRIQQKLLRFLQEKEIERVGDAKPIKLDVRIITATNANLKEMVENGEFREDLYFRFKVMEVHLPPLIERREDIPLLTEHFIEKFNEKMNRQVRGASSEVIDIFMQYGWPGNIRELEHTIEHAFILCRGPILTADLLPRDLTQDLVSAERSPERDEKEQGDLPKKDEKQQLLDILVETDWNKAKTARRLGLSRRTIYRQMVRYNIIPPDEQ